MELWALLWMRPILHCSSHRNDTTHHRVKWDGGLSPEFSESQGVRQGGIWSPTAYIFFLNPLLVYLKQEEIGLKIGNIYFGTLACCDDLLLISDNYIELMTMIDFTKKFADLEHYIISDTKTKVQIYNYLISTESWASTEMWTLGRGGGLLEVTNSYTHIGQVRDWM